MISELNWETLNAYVDGELSSREAAAVADAVAQDPELARQVALLTSLKASVAGALPLPDRDLLGRRAAKRRRPLWRAVAAVLLGVGMVAALVAFGPGGAPPQTGVELAQRAHREWLGSLHQTQGPQATTLLKSNLDALGLDVYVPDLAGLQLSFDGVRALRDPGPGAGLHVGYRGARGCRVSLVILPEGRGVPAPLTREEHGGQPVYTWTLGRSSFHLLAQGMDPLRFAEVAKVVHRMTRTRLPLDTDTILALDRLREETRPCIA